MSPRPLSFNSITAPQGIEKIGLKQPREVVIICIQVSTLSIVVVQQTEAFEFQMLMEETCCIALCTFNYTLYVLSFVLVVLCTTGLLH